jgi:hypothetical protein
MTGSETHRSALRFWAALLGLAVGLGLAFAGGYWLGRTNSRPGGAENSGPRPGFPAAADDGLLAQVGLMQHVTEVSKEYQVFYPRPYAAPPEITINTYPPERYELIEQRKDGFRIRFKILAAEGEPPSYRARGVPAKPGE